MLDLSDVSCVRRVVVGSSDPEHRQTAQEVQAAIDLLNRCLSDSPRGRILGIEKSFSILNVGENQVVQSSVVYHIGFARRPMWLDA